jgi:hypothetical protein
VDAGTFPAADVCVFCGARGVDTALGHLSIEHAFPGWINKRLDPQSDVIWRLDGLVVPDRDVFEVEIRAVCQPCNTGWMDLMEKKISRWIGPSLNDGHREFQLDRHQREVLGAWVVKTALMVELALRELRRPSFLPESHFRWLYAKRNAVTPPPGAQIWMFGVNQPFGTGQRLQIASAQALTLGPAAPGVPPAYFSTFHAGLIGFQVFGPDAEASQPGAIPPPLAVPQVTAPALFQVWPAPVKPPIKWPPKTPRRIVNTADLNTFAQWPRIVTRP